MTFWKAEINDFLVELLQKSRKENTNNESPYIQTLISAFGQKQVKYNENKALETEASLLNPVFNVYSGHIASQKCILFIWTHIVQP